MRLVERTITIKSRFHLFVSIVDYCSDKVVKYRKINNDINFVPINKF